MLKCALPRGFPSLPSEHLRGASPKLLKNISTSCSRFGVPAEVYFRQFCVFVQICAHFLSLTRAQPPVRAAASVYPLKRCCRSGSRAFPSHPGRNVFLRRGCRVPAPAGCSLLSKLHTEQRDGGVVLCLGRQSGSSACCLFWGVTPASVKSFVPFSCRTAVGNFSSIRWHEVPQTFTRSYYTEESLYRITWWISVALFCFSCAAIVFVQGWVLI